MEAAVGLDKARKESSSRAVTLPAEVHSGCGFRCSGMFKQRVKIVEEKWRGKERMNEDVVLRMRAPSEALRHMS